MIDNPPKQNKFLALIILGVFLLGSILTSIADDILWSIWLKIGFAWDIDPMFGLQTLTRPLNAIANVIIALLIWAIAIRGVLKQRLRDIAFRFHCGWFADLIFGLAFSSATVITLFSIGAVAGWFEIFLWTWFGSPVWVIIGWFWICIMDSISLVIIAEVSSRAFLLDGLAKAWGKRKGLLATAVIFASYELLVSISGIGLEDFQLILIVVSLTLLLGWIYTETGSLWLPIGIHIALDFLLAENPYYGSNRNWTVIRILDISSSVQGPLPISPPVNIMFLYILVILLVFLGSWLWLRLTRSRRQQSSLPNVTNDNLN